MFNVSETALQAVLRDIREGNTEFVDQFFASRPEWRENGDQGDQGDQETEKTKEAVTA